LLLRTKITLHIVLMSLLMVAIGFGGLWSAWFMRGRLLHISDASAPAVQALARAESALWSAVREDGNPEEGFREMEEAVRTYALHTPHPRGEALKRAIRSGMLELQELSDDGEEEGARRKRRIESLNDLIGEALDAESDFLTATRNGVQHRFRTATLMNLCLVALGLLFGLLYGRRLAVRISRSLNDVQKAANEVASGDLTLHLPEKGGDEIAVLSRSFNRMVETIRQADEEISKEVEERLQAERQAQVAARAKSDFLAHMSHEFRTPLNGILGYSQILELDKGLSEKNREVVRSLKRSGENLLELVNDVLDLTKIEAQRMTLRKGRFYLRDFLESIAETYQEQIRHKGLEFKLTLEEGLPEDILADQIRLRQVLVNLVGNAIKYTDAGFIHLEAMPLEAGVRFQVRDSGIGIPEEDLENVLEPFTQVDVPGRKSQGTGLGLSITTRLLEMMDTRLQVESELGEGSAFWFDLPQPDVKQRKMVVSPRSFSGYEGPQKTVLIAEKDSETVMLLAPLLRKVGFGVHLCRNGDSFRKDLSLVEPDAVIYDLYFREPDGLKLMRRVFESYDREERVCPPFLVFSDHRQTTDRERALSAGAAAFLGKPVRFTDLLNLLEEHLGVVWTEEEERDETEAAKEVSGPLTGHKLPDASRLLDIRELARAGNVRELKNHLEGLREAVPEYAEFCEQLLTLCQGYRINAVLDSLEDSLKRKEEETS